MFDDAVSPKSGGRIGRLNEGLSGGRQDFEHCDALREHKLHLRAVRTFLAAVDQRRQNAALKWAHSNVNGASIR